jgi:hypothetical protein
MTHTRLKWILIACFALGTSLMFLRSQPVPQSPPAATMQHTSTNEVAALRADIETLRIEVGRLKGLVPDQAHAMEDVGYHFANLWFAAEQENWPLADFYLAETRSHLRWAVRIIPVRKTKAGEVELQGILDAVDKTPGVMLSAIKTAIEQQDTVAFTNAYRQTIEGCYACHKASEKPFIRPQVPKALAEQIINLDPNATWPQ